MNEKEKIYLNKIQQEFDVKRTSIIENKKRFKISYENLYNKLISERKLIIKAQGQLISKTGKDICNCKTFTTKNKAAIAWKYLISLYATNTDKPINKRILKRTKEILKYLEKEENGIHKRTI